MPFGVIQTGFVSYLDANDSQHARARALIERLESDGHEMGVRAERTFDPEKKGWKLTPGRNRGA